MRAHNLLGTRPISHSILQPILRPICCTQFSFGCAQFRAQFLHPILGYDFCHYLQWFCVIYQVSGADMSSVQHHGTWPLDTHSRKIGCSKLGAIHHQNWVENWVQNCMRNWVRNWPQNWAHNWMRNWARNLAQQTWEIVGEIVGKHKN